MRRRFLLDGPMLLPIGTLKISVPKWAMEAFIPQISRMIFLTIDSQQAVLYFSKVGHEFATFHVDH